jgi:hypothetical protein
VKIEGLLTKEVRIRFTPVHMLFSEELRLNSEADGAILASKCFESRDLYGGPTGAAPSKLMVHCAHQVGNANLLC